MGSWWKCSSCPSIPGSSVASSTPSCAPARCGPTRCSPGLSPPRWRISARRLPPAYQRRRSLRAGNSVNSVFGPALVLIAGPCALERDDINLKISEVLAGLGARLGIRVVYKGSFDKANRATPRAPRGLGLDRGLAALDRVRAETSLPVLTDVHEASQVAAVAAVVDAIQIPALLARQTDLLTAAGRSGRPVNVKKGQSMAPADIGGAVGKVREGGGRDIVVTERGTF